MAFAATKVTGSGAGSSPYFGQWNITGCETGDLTLTLEHGLTMSGLSPAAGGNNATPTTIPQATLVTITPTNAAGITASFFLASVTDTTITITGVNAPTGTARVTIQRAQVGGW